MALQPLEERHPKKHPPLLDLFLITVAVLGVLTVAKAMDIGNDWRVAVNDFTQDYVSARAQIDGRSPYEPTADLVRRYLGSDVLFFTHRQANPHPPFAILLARPLVSLSYRTARFIWMGIISLSLIVAIWLIARTTGHDSRRGALIAVGALALPISQLSLINAQANAFVLLLIVLAWLDLRKGHQVRAGIALGTATALKLFPLLLIIPVLRRRQRHAARWQIISFVVLSALATASIGTSSSTHYFTEVIPGNNEFWRSAPHNISLTAIPFRWLTQNRWHEETLNLPMVAWALSLAIIALGIFGAIRTPALLTGDLFWAGAPFMILVAPYAWEDYLILMFPLALIVYERIQKKRMRASAVVLCCLAFLMTGSRSFANWSNDPFTQLAVFALPTYALLVVVIGEWWTQARTWQNSTPPTP